MQDQSLVLQLITQVQARGVQELFREVKLNVQREHTAVAHLLVKIADSIREAQEVFLTDPIQGLLEVLTAEEVQEVEVVAAVAQEVVEVEDKIQQ